MRQSLNYSRIRIVPVRNKTYRRRGRSLIRARVTAGIWLNRLIQRSTGRKKKDKILSGLREELKTEKKKLDDFFKEINKPDRPKFPLYLIRTETWNAFSDGGELEWIDKPELLDKLAETYFSIRNVNFLSERIFDLLLTAFVSTEFTANEGPVKYHDQKKVV